MDIAIAVEGFRENIKNSMRRDKKTKRFAIMFGGLVSLACTTVMSVLFMQSYLDV